MKAKYESVNLQDTGDMNETELVTLAQKMGYEGASRRLLREDLIALIFGEIESPEDPFDGMRKKLVRYVNQNYREIQKSSQPCDFHCTVCPRNLVVDCYLDNQDLIENS